MSTGVLKHGFKGKRLKKRKVSPDLSIEEDKDGNLVEDGNSYKIWLRIFKFDLHMKNVQAKLEDDITIVCFMIKECILVV